LAEDGASLTFLERSADDDRLPGGHGASAAGEAGRGTEAILAPQWQAASPTGATSPPPTRSAFLAEISAAICIR
jgi:hypothetical protein